MKTSGLTVVRAGILSLLGASMWAQEQLVNITGLTLDPGGDVLLDVATLLDPDALYLESADLLTGLWMKEPTAGRTVFPGVGVRYSTPRQPYHTQRFFRVGVLGASPTPCIEGLVPVAVLRPGDAVSLVGANFDPSPAGNVVMFQSFTGSWAATVTQANPNWLLVASPPGLDVSNIPAGMTEQVFMVTVTTAAGVSNSIGCGVGNAAPGLPPAFTVQPGVVQLPLPPSSSGVAVVGLGGGTPPYTLQPLTPAQQAVVTAQIDGSRLIVTGVSPGFVSLTVSDSSAPQQSAFCSVFPVTVPSSLSLSSAVSFHTRLAGSSPAVTVDCTPGTALQLERVNLQFTNMGVEVEDLAPSQLVGLVSLTQSNAIVGFAHMVIRRAGNGRATFDIQAQFGDYLLTLGSGELVSNPPSLVIGLSGKLPESLLPSKTMHLVIYPGIARLPSAVGQVFSVEAQCHSVSTSRTVYSPTQKGVGPFNFTTVGTASARIERLDPIEGEVRRYVRIYGTGFDPVTANNVVTFAGPGGARLATTIFQHLPDQLVVPVPANAVTGAVRVTIGGQNSNDYRFAVRFRPRGFLTFSNFQADTPTAPQLMFDQPSDDLFSETFDEVDLASITCILDGGSVSVAGLTIGQQVGSAESCLINSGFFSGKKNLYAITYQGQEPTGAQRHVFRLDSTGFGFSGTTREFLYYADRPGGGVVLEYVDSLDMSKGLSGPGINWNFNFTSPIYRPPQAVGATVNFRIDMKSEAAMGLPSTEMLVTDQGSRVTQ